MDKLLTRTFIPEVVKADPDSRRVTHKISDDSLDRMNDAIEPLGWETEAYQRNPVVLADHNYQIGSIIGKSVALKATKAGLFATTEFGEDGLGPQAFALVQSGLAKAWSVGFKSIDSHTVMQGVKAKCPRCKKTREQIIGEKDPDESGFVFGRHFVKQELLEYSLVAIPANPNAVSAAIQKGVVDPDSALTLFRPAVRSILEPDNARSRRLDAIRAVSELLAEAREPWRPSFSARRMTRAERLAQVQARLQ
jgi:phage head maturation protease